MVSSFTKTAADQSVLEHLNDMVSIVDKHYVYRAVSKGYSKLFDKSIDEIVGTTVVDLHGEEVFHATLKDSLDRTLQGEEIEFQFSRQTHCGHTVHIHSKHTVYKGPLTDGPGVAVVARDVTELVETAEQLARERTLLRNIVNTLPDLIFVKDSNGVYQFSNRSFEEFLNKSPDQILGKTDADLMSERSSEYIRKMDNQVKQSAKASRCDEWVTYADGRRRLLDMYKMPLSFDDNEELGIIGIGSNVTYERQAEQTRRMASLFFEVTENPCFILNDEADIVEVNNAARKKLGIAGKIFGNVFDYLSCVSSNAGTLKEMTGNTDYWQGDLCGNRNSVYQGSLHRVSDQGEMSDRYIMILKDPADGDEMTQDLLTKAYQDPLTELPNRRLFISKLESAIIRAERQLRKIAVLYIDLNNFKSINDNFGHSEGDGVLIDLSKLLASCFRKTDTLARIGGDEFAGLIDVNDKAEAEIVVDKIHQVLAQTGSDNCLNKYGITASVGISYFPDDGQSVIDLINRADREMYALKGKQQRPK